MSVIIIKNIYPTIGIDDLENFVNPVVKGRFYQKTGQLKSIKIVSLIDKQGMEVERYGLVTVCSDKIRDRLIKKLNGQYLGYDKPVVAAFRDRLWQNDKRVYGQSSCNEFIEKRTGDRRRLSLKKLVLEERSWPFSIPMHILSNSRNPRRSDGIG